MAFRFNNPLKRIANTNAAINRGPGQFGQVSSSIAKFNDIQKNIGRISSGIGQISGNKNNLFDIITNANSAGDLINNFAGNSSLQNTFRSVSALTRDVQSLVPGNSRVASQAATLSRRAEDLFSNTQRNAQGIQSITGGITDVLNGTLDVGNLTGRSLGPLTGGLNLGQLVPGLQNVNIFGGFKANNVSSNTSAAIRNITQSAPELQAIQNQPINVVPRSVAELSTPIGERYDGLREVVEIQSNESPFNDFVDNTFKPFNVNPISQDRSIGQFRDLPTAAFGVSQRTGTAYSKIPNPLRNYISHNYVITLGILSAKEYNSPNVYREAGGFETVICKSGGGSYDKRYQNDDEYNNSNPGHAEYYIDNLEMDAVIAPNPNTNVSLGTSLSFTVTEPYSMGNFIEAIIGAAAISGFQNYLDAPFCFKIDFVGWDEYGNRISNTDIRPIFIPVLFTKVDFNVDGKGSVYEITAVPMSETGLGDDINEIKTPINANGDLVHNTLETGARSVTNIMNDRISAMETSGTIAPFDRYVIVFPKSRKALTEYLERDIINPDALKIDVSARVRDALGRQDGLGENEAIEFSRDLRQQYNQRNENIIEATINSVGRMYAKLKTFAEDEGEMNEIGLSTLIENVAEGGNQGQASYSSTVTDPNDPRGQVARNSAGAAPAERSRDYQFQQGNTITDVIERMVLNSEFARTRSTEPGRNGIRRWFKIDTLTFIEENPETENQIGRPPRVYVYSVIPYDADEAKFNAPNERSPNTEGLKASAAKEYNYIYTGKNEDVLNFDISFNNAFTQTAFANFGQNAGGALTSPGADGAVAIDEAQGAATSRNTGAGANSVNGKVQERTQTSSTSANAVRSGDIRRKIAEMFHDRITNQTVDMISAEMEIIGDPFFVPQEMGNFVAEPGDKPSTTQEGTMQYHNSEVFVVVNFKTPFDYQIEGATIEFPKVVPQFSGLFSAWAVTNTFSGGKFTQLLKLLRRRGQDDPPTDNNTGPVKVDDDAVLDQENSTGDTQTGNTDVNSGSSSGTSNSTPSNNTPTQSQPAGVVVPTPVGRRFPSIDSAINSAIAYQQANPGFNYTIKPGTNGGFTVKAGAAPAQVNRDLTDQVQQSGSSSTSAQQPTSPAC